MRTCGCITRVMPLASQTSSIPAIVENDRSSGVATAAAIVSGLAPGRLAVTWIAVAGFFLFWGLEYYAAPLQERAYRDDHELFKPTGLFTRAERVG